MTQIPTDHAIITSLSNHKECVKCEGRFLWNEKVYLDIFNQPYCEVCFREEINRDANKPRD